MELRGAVLLDTHVWVWLQSRNSTRLSKESFRQAEAWQAEGRLYVSAASAWEIAQLVARKKIDLGRSVEHWIATGLEDGGLQMLPLSTRILIESTRLPGDLHRDPADRMLIATAREHNLTLLTRDEKILQYAANGHAKVRSPK